MEGTQGVAWAKHGPHLDMGPTPPTVIQSTWDDSFNRTPEKGGPLQYLESRMQSQVEKDALTEFRCKALTETNEVVDRHEKALPISPVDEADLALACSVTLLSGHACRCSKAAAAQRD